MARLKRFLDRVDRYYEDRDRPDLDSTSRFSIDLKYAFISPRTVVRAVGTASRGRPAFGRHLAWRDFYGHLLTACPTW